MSMLALLALFGAPSVGAGEECPPYPPVDGAACPKPGKVCIYRKRGVACECARPSKERATWTCSEGGE
ncbi:hypothetical protein BH09MYX1_BH09MYX1_58210 [soil metagenome]